MRKPQFTEDGIRHATINGHRFHLRLTDPGKDNFLWIDGFHPPMVLDQVAAEFVGHIIDGMRRFQSGKRDGADQVTAYVLDRMQERYTRRFPRRSISRDRLKSDLDRIFGTLM